MSDITFGQTGGSDSFDCLDLFLDGKGDTTIRPCPPELLPSALAERAKLARWKESECVDLIVDGPGDTTVRPCPPELLASSMAEREKILRWQKLQEKPAPREHPNGPSEGRKS